MYELTYDFTFEVSSVSYLLIYLDDVNISTAQMSHLSLNDDENSRDVIELGMVIWIFAFLKFALSQALLIFSEETCRTAIRLGKDIHISLD